MRITAALLALYTMVQVGQSQTKDLEVEVFDSGFARSHGTFNGMGAASDGKIYYVLCSNRIDTGAQMFSYDPSAGKIKHLGDLTEASGEKDLKAIPQGKSHVNFVEYRGKLYFATHVGYYSIVGGREKMGVPEQGYKPYPGGHFLAYDMASGKFENLAAAPAGEGIISMNMDTERGRLYGLTWPSGRFLRFDMKAGELKDLGPVTLDGEDGDGSRYRILCRSLALDPRDGSVYFTTADGDIMRYRYDRDAIETLEGENMRKDYFGAFPAEKLGMGYNWRQTFWHESQKAIYGLHGTSGYLFRFDPRVPRVDVLERITSEPSRRTGMNDEFSYGYLGFALGPDRRTVYYLTTGPILDANGKRMPVGSGARRRPQVDLRLVTYDLLSAKCEDRGPILLPDGQRPQTVHSIAVSRDGTVYTMGAFTRNGRPVADLIRIRVR